MLVPLQINWHGGAPTESNQAADVASSTSTVHPCTEWLRLAYVYRRGVLATIFTYHSHQSSFPVISHPSSFVTIVGNSSSKWRPKCALQMAAKLGNFKSVRPLAKYCKYSCVESSWCVTISSSVVIGLPGGLSYRCDWYRAATFQTSCQLSLGIKPLSRKSLTFFINAHWDFTFRFRAM